MQENGERDETNSSLDPLSRSFTGQYLAGKTIKKRAIELNHPEAVWILEYFHDGMRAWLYIERGKGIPFGPWQMERAIHEMGQWAKSTQKPKWSSDGVEWRIRNVQTNEVIPHNIFPG